MSLATTEEPRIVHTLPGRVRVHLPGWKGDGRCNLEAQLRQLNGVLSAKASSLTGNVLLHFDPQATDDESILATLRSLDPNVSEEEVDEEPGPPPVQREWRAPAGRARIAVRGLDRDSDLARRVVEGLESRPSVKVRPNQLTGRVLVEFDEHRVELEELLEEISGMELPELPGEDRPAHPLNRGPLVQTATRTTGALLGLGLLAARRLLGLTEPPVAGGAPATAAGVIGLFEDFPITRNALQRLLGENASNVVFSMSAILALTMSGNVLGLMLAGAGAFRLFTEVRARRAAWLNYEDRIQDAAPAQPGAVVRLEPGERAPLPAKVLEGNGTAVRRDGLPIPLLPGTNVPAGARVHGGPFTLKLDGDEPFKPELRPEPQPKTMLSRYRWALERIQLAYAAATALFTRSFSRTFTALLLVSPRAAEIGRQSADAGAYARVLRSGVTVVGTRPERDVRLPGILLLDGARTLTQGLEISGVLPQVEDCDASEVLELASAVATAAGSPWGRTFTAAGRLLASEGAFDGETATACIGEVRYSLGPQDREQLPSTARLRDRGSYLLRLYTKCEGRTLGVIALRPRLAPGVARLVETCTSYGVEVALLGGGDPMANQSVAHRAQVPLLAVEDAVEAVRDHQRNGKVVALVSDSMLAAAGFAASDLAIGLSSGQSGNFPARADLLAPDLEAVAAIVESGARREAAVRDSVLISMVGNLFGAAWGYRSAPAVQRASYGVYAAALSAMALGWIRLRGGKRRGLALSLVADPRPEQRWGQRSVADVLRTLETSEAGLTTEAAVQRQQTNRYRGRRNKLLQAVLDELRSPMTAVMSTGAILSFLLGQIADVLMIGAVIAANVTVSAWQERQAGHATEALESLSTPTARVLRDGSPITLSAGDIVPGDVLLLASGDRVAADARLIEAQGLEVDEAALTGESLPVLKSPEADTGTRRIVLEDSDVTAGTGRAVVVAVGRDTRMGATAAALDLEEEEESALGARLSRLLRQVLPLIVTGGAIVTASGLLWRRPILQQFAVGASVAIAAVPEGLPLLAGTGEAAVARRLAGRNALVRRISAVEALGRVDVACTDKTGTLTEGRLALSLVSDMDEEAAPSDELSVELRQVLLTAALASPRPDTPGAESHPTDATVVQGAREAGLEDELWEEREAESPFNPAQSFHASTMGGHLYVKGAAETLVPRCDRLRRNGEDSTLDEAGRTELLAHAESLAERGLRVLMVAEGSSRTLVDNPNQLLALGFLGISDPLRPTVPEAVRRCHEAGVRVVMLTGDHPATARAIAREAGLPLGNGELLTGEEIAELGDGELDECLEHATVVSRITPLDKLRIVESLKRRGHTVAMTGDGVNDAPALRLADVGVAMGQGGTEVARQAADVVLADDDFSTLVETLVEGRSFWRNIRRALGLLLGGNLGELGLMVGANIFSPTVPLNSRQILAINLVSDVLPAVSIAFQQPKHRNLAELDREGEAALERPLRNDVLRRGIATATPSLAAYLIALGAMGMPQAGSVAFASVVATQLAQTLSLGRNVEGFSRSVLGAVAGSTGLLVAALTLAPLRSFLALSPPGSMGWALIGAAALAAAPLNYLLASSSKLPGPNALPPPTGKESTKSLILGGDEA